MSLEVRCKGEDGPATGCFPSQPGSQWTIPSSNSLHPPLPPQSLMRHHPVCGHQWPKMLAAQTLATKFKALVTSSSSYQETRSLLHFPGVKPPSPNNLPPPHLPQVSQIFQPISLSGSQTTGLLAASASAMCPEATPSQRTCLTTTQTTLNL